MCHKFGIPKDWRWKEEGRVRNIRLVLVARRTNQKRKSKFHKRNSILVLIWSYKTVCLMILSSINSRTSIDDNKKIKILRIVQEHRRCPRNKEKQPNKVAQKKHFWVLMLSFETVWLMFQQQQNRSLENSTGT